MIYELEKEILDTFGYCFEDFKNDDARNLFDLNRNSDDFIRLLNYYISKPLQPKFLKLLDTYDLKYKQLLDAMKIINNIVDFKFDECFMIEFNDFLSKCKNL